VLAIRTDRVPDVLVLQAPECLNPLLLGYLDELSSHQALRL
jgi:hypothetical protein